MRNSFFWKLTKPFRFIKRFVQAPMRTCYELASYLFWHSPPAVQRFLERPVRQSLQTYRRVRWRLFGKHPLIDDIARTFDVTKKFIHVLHAVWNPLDLSKSNWPDYFESLSPLEKLYTQFALSTVGRGRSMLSLLASHNHIHHRRRYLDVGTGYGGFLRAARELGFQEVIGIEINPMLVDLAKANTTDLSEAQVITGDFIKQDFSRLGVFDLITCNDVIEHVADPELAIQKMADLLTEEGSLCFEVPNKDCIPFVKADGHFLMFGITQLSRSNAAIYYSGCTGEDPGGYLKEMGEMYELDWYVKKLSENGLSSSIADTHIVGTIAQVPEMVAELKDAYRTWQVEKKPKLDPAIAAQLAVSVETFMVVLEKDYSNLDSEEQKQAFQNKYLRSFWTIMATRDDIPSPV
jgi:2-polyprenyl-3-methyl-5-hydroxy-6-metoxy-1,4-benzoquinol methylase